MSSDHESSVSKYLKGFLDRSENSVSREVLLAHRVTYEFKIGSALSGFDLRAYRPDVDRDGFDLLIEQRSLARVIQLKTVGRRAKTVRWKVKSHLLHPSTRRSGRLKFSLPALGLGDGLDGALLVVDFEVERESINIGYRLFDLAVAAAHTLRITGVSEQKAEEASALLWRLRKAEGHGAVIIPAWMLIRLPTAESVLSVLGMRTRYAGGFWYEALLAYAKENHGDYGSEERSVAELCAKARRDLQELQSGSPVEAV